MFVSHFFGDQPMSSSTATASIIHLGLDVHKDSVTIAVLPEGAPAPTRIDKYPNDFTKLRRVFERHAEDGELRACYEASGAGYVLQRAMRAWGYHCDVIAPSLIPTKPGVQRKHDKYDAGQLARLYRAGELTVIRIPSEAEERVPFRPPAQQVRAQAPVRVAGGRGCNRSRWRAPSRTADPVAGSRAGVQRRRSAFNIRPDCLAAPSAPTPRSQPLLS
jgi:hypothetical protein